jgi:hypothetical protein
MGRFCSGAVVSASRSQACAMWDRVTRASRSPNVRAISRHCCARRRYSSALLTATTLARPSARRQNAGGGNWFGLIDAFPGAVGSGGTDLHPRGDGCAECPALQRRCGARGAHVASSMVDERLKGPFCLQRAVEGPTVKYPRASSYTPQPTARWLNSSTPPDSRGEGKLLWQRLLPPPRAATSSSTRCPGSHGIQEPQD